MSIAKLPRGDKYPEVFNVVIEIPRGSHNKYEYDEELGVIKIDRVNYTAMAHPHDYGFIPGTRSDDGDHLDAFVMLDESAPVGVMVEARPVGVLKMVDDGENDEKIISVPAKDPRYDEVQDLADLGAHFQKEVQHFFEHYKDLQNKKVEILGWGDKDEAIKVLEAAVE